MSTCLFVYLTICLFVYLSTCLYVYLSMCLCPCVLNRIYPYCGRQKTATTASTLLFYSLEERNFLPDVFATKVYIYRQKTTGMKVNKDSLQSLYFHRNENKLLKGKESCSFSLSFGFDTFLRSLKS